MFGMKRSHQIIDENPRNRCLDDSLSEEDVILMGMYRMNKKQSVVYDKFVDMLSTFDRFDVVIKIILLY